MFHIKRIRLAFVTAPSSTENIQKLLNKATHGIDCTDNAMTLRHLMFASKAFVDAYSFISLIVGTWTP